MKKSIITVAVFFAVATLILSIGGPSLPVIPETMHTEAPILHR